MALSYEGLNGSKYRCWFKFVDKDEDGRITGQEAKSLFPRAELQQKALATIWAMADFKRSGFLDFPAFCKAMDLISMAQEGKDLTEAEYQRSRLTVDAPQMKGLDAEVGDMASVGDNPFGDVQDTSAGKGKGKGTNVTLGKKKVAITSVVDGLKEIYFSRLHALEDTYKFAQFFGPLLNLADFDAKPSVLMLGQYSTGKTTFIRHLLGREYPGANIGPEPTTDRFTVVMHGYEERRIPGNTLAVSPDQPYQSLHHFGAGFLGRLEGATCNTPLLESISIVDTPGVLSGEKQRIERAYSFIQVCGWFAARADLILLLFDPYKLDISDEFRATIEAMKGHEEKVRVVLNKADQVDQQQLMRVYGALMWSLGKVFRNPEVCRVYVGSFNGGKEVRSDINPHGKALFEAEQADLMRDLDDIPKRSCDRKINELVKRVRALKVHLLILQYLKKQIGVFYKQSTQTKLLDNLGDHFETIKQQNNLAVGDFPNVNTFRDILSVFDLSQLPKITERMIKTVDEVLMVEIPLLVNKFSNPY